MEEGGMSNERAGSTSSAATQYAVLAILVVRSIASGSLPVVFPDCNCQPTKVWDPRDCLF